MPQVPTTDAWKDWIDTDCMCSTPISERKSSAHTFPVYFSVSQEWMVFEPFGDDYMIVSGEDYEAHRVEKARVKFASQVPLSGL